MPNADGNYTREEFIEKYGYDPLGEQTPEQPEARGGVKDHLRSAAVGAASTFTDLYGAAGSIGPAVNALYNTYGTDKTFMDEFSKNIQVEGAQDNLSKHLQEVADYWRQEKPELTDDEVNAGLEDYKKSKQFEDMAESQLRHMPRVAAKSKSAIRSFLGDERPESERSWTESGVEAVGGALIGLPLGPAGWATAASRIPGVVGKVASNAAVRGVIKTAEVLTPVTMPYTAGNVALNATAGVGLDQGARYLQGKSTAFTPTNTDVAGLGTLIAGGTGFIGLAALFSAMKGKAHIALQANQAAHPSTTQQTLAQTPTLNSQVPATSIPGQAAVASGPPQTQPLTPWIDAVNPVRNATLRAKNEAVSEDIIPLAAIRDIHGSKVADEAERIYDANVASTLHDDIAARMAELTYETERALRNTSPDRARALQTGAHMTSYVARHNDALARINDEIADIQQQLAGGRLTPASVTSKQTRLASLQNDLQRVARDDPDARMMLPNTPMRDAHSMSNAFIRDTSPDAMAFKKALSDLNKAWRDMDVEAGRMSPADAAREHAANPYYTPALHDPFEGATGATHMWRSVVNTVRNSHRKADVKGDTTVAREGTIDQLGRYIPEARLLGAPETRITSLLDVRGAQRGFLQNHMRETAHATMRNEFVRRYSHMDAARTIPTSFYTNGHMREVVGRGNQTVFTRAQLHSTGETGMWLREQLNNRHIVPEWIGGDLRLWEFADRPIAAMLRQEPIILDGVMRGVARTTQLVKQMSTGYGNPLFPPIGAMYNLMIHSFIKRNDRAFGPLSNALRHVLPKSVAKHTLGRVPDLTALTAIPWHLFRNFVDLFAMNFTRIISDTLANQNSMFSSMRYAMGQRNFDRMVRGAASLSTWVHEHAVLHELRSRGIGRNLGAVDNIERVRSVYGTINDNMPAPVKAVWSFYKDLADMVYLTPQRMHYTENMGLLRREYRNTPGGIPKSEIDKLISETRFLGGNMHKMPAGKWARGLEATFPYLTQAKLGAYELTRNMGSRSTLTYVLPTMALGMYGIGQSMYWRTYWNEESKRAFWNRPDHEIWRYISIPTAELALAWFRGENPNYSRSLYYDILIPPDLVGIMAGTGAIMQTLGMLPSNVTTEPIASQWPKLMLKSLVPMMPPLVQVIMAQSSMKLDPSSADTHSGNLIRQVGSNFRAGPQSESMSNLGQVSNSTALIMNALFGTFGTHIAAGTDVFLHASKYYPPGDEGKLTLREQSDFGLGLRKALGTVLDNATKNVPDIPGLVPLVWQSREKYSVMTPHWQSVNESMQYIHSIVGMKDEAKGKMAALYKKYAGMAGGIPKEAVTDVALIQTMEAIAQFQNPSGPLGKLQKQYKAYSQTASSVNSNYNLSNEERHKTVNNIIQKQQDNMQQRYLAIKYLEQRIALKFGERLAPRLQGRKITIATLDQMMRESIGSPDPSAVYSQAGAEQSSE